MIQFAGCLLLTSRYICIQLSHLFVNFNASYLTNDSDSVKNNMTRQIETHHV